MRSRVKEWLGEDQLQKNKASHLPDERPRKTPLLRLAFQMERGFLSSLRCGSYRGGRPDSQVVSINRAADRRRQRSRKIIGKETEKRPDNGLLRNTSTDSKGETFVI